MTKAQIKTIDAQELKTRMDLYPDLCLIDVRDAYQWKMAHIPGAVHIPNNEIAIKIQSKVEDKSHPIYLQCNAGVLSLYSAQTLIDLGYENVYSVDGGLSDWTMLGYPVVN